MVNKFQLAIENHLTEISDQAHHLKQASTNAVQIERTERILSSVRLLTTLIQDDREVYRRDVAEAKAQTAATLLRKGAHS